MWSASGGPGSPASTARPRASSGTSRSSPEDGPLHATAFAWAEAGPDFEPRPRSCGPPASSPPSRTCTRPWAAVVAARQVEAAALAAAYERVLTIQVETIERRAALGLAVGVVSLDAVAGRLRRAVHDGQAPPEIEAVLQEVRARVRASGLGRRDRPADAELDKVLARIQALQGEDRGPRLHRGGGDRGGGQGGGAARPLRPVAGRGRAQGAGLRGLRGRHRPAPVRADRRLHPGGGRVLRLPGLEREGGGRADPLRVLRAAGGRGRGALPLRAGRAGVRD